MKRGCKESCGLHRAGWMQLILLLPLLHLSQEKKQSIHPVSSVGYFLYCMSCSDLEDWQRGDETALFGFLIPHCLVAEVCQSRVEMKSDTWFCYHEHIEQCPSAD